MATNWQGDEPAPQGPLTGLKVLDLTTSYAGPTATMYLTDMGADVLKVERTGGGDEARGWGPPFVDGVSAWFASANRNKRSIAINFKKPDGLELLHTLIGQADVLIQSFNPSKLTKLGLDPTSIRSRYPRLVYCAMSGVGLDGPDRHLPGYDLAAQARSGLMSLTGAKGGSPQRVSTALSDVVTGMCAALAICAAAVQQQATGQGDVIDVSLLDSDLALGAPRIAAYLAGESEPAPSGGTDSVLAVYQTFPTRDRDIAIAIGNDQMWQRFCQVANLPDLANDPELGDNAGRRLNRHRIITEVCASLSRRTAAEWIKILADVSVPASLVQSLSEVVQDHQVVARGSIMQVPGHDGLYSVRGPFRFGTVPEPRNERFPDPGQHTVDVLRQAGLNDGDIADLLQANVVGTWPTTNSTHKNTSTATPAGSGSV